MRPAPIVRRRAGRHRIRREDDVRSIRSVFLAFAAVFFIDTNAASAQQVDGPGLPAQRETFGGIPSAKEIDRLVEVIKASGADVAGAVGGGIYDGED